ncbi:coiled-coil domain-containing protein 167 isoform X2 [Xiphophorus couchianus]|uniref:coiled-coil domain-containing protein 167 isoform X2 n=1 Tax=Xiphophorus couchianus TaxID=32473 RepID=UPI001016DE6A|nr:coiled-coil domain-containing protein 167 isoform X2 [Xiphophorus couchianus]XP_032441118.1 coiled-coil domain-containing protein 167 isoform X2 [Xiphophorus hellerii]
MAKMKDKKRENIDRLEERRERCQDNLERAEFKSRKARLSEQDRQELENEMAIINERVQKLDKELAMLRGENRRNMVLSVALLTISALFYYVFFYNEDET